MLKLILPKNISLQSQFPRILDTQSRNNWYSLVRVYSKRRCVITVCGAYRFFLCQPCFFSLGHRVYWSLFMHPQTCNEIQTMHNKLWIQFYKYCGWTFLVCTLYSFIFHAFLTLMTAVYYLQAMILVQSSKEDN